ncbi:hypothetical protein LPJ73_000091 [Coemansia sp. RSA 2703]|nr:hypothetical protein LPJ73_000091 [Coemansia sp. RSA 2703]KAJ2379463.1 hypothetical protein IW150_000144 [Coemansia sp. RSA 2607]KAJ2398381.1 hypothetical protein GGI05_000127 [Coemansia sp. RSA 2603]
MGKAPKRTFKDRINPLVSAAVPNVVSKVSSKEEVPALLKKLTSSDANDRVWAAASASNLLVSDDSKVRRMLLANNVVSALIERLSDSVPDVVIQATGALHNLAAVDQGAAEEISRKNIYAAIQALVPRLAKSIDDIIKDNDDGKKLDNNARTMVFLTTDNLISILWVLCETVPSSLKHINGMALIPFLISFFNVVGKLPSSLIQTAGQFLYTLTQDNIHAKRALISHPNSIQNLMKVVVSQQPCENVTAEDVAVVRILAGGILSNIKPAVVAQLEKTYKNHPGGIPAEETEQWETHSKVLLQVIADYIALDIHDAAARAAATIKAITMSRSEAVTNGVERTAEAKHEGELDSLNTRISYVQLALELAANIFTDEGASDPDSDPATATTDSASGQDNEVAVGGEDGEDVDQDHEMADDSDSEEDVIESDVSDDEDGHSSAEEFDVDDMEELLAEESTTAQKTDEEMQHSILGAFISVIIPSLRRLAEPTSMSTLTTALNECLTPNTSDSFAIQLVTSTVESFATLHDRALGCFNNFLLVIEESIKSWFRLHSDSVASWWSFLIAVAEHLFSVENPSAEFVATDQRLRFVILEPTVGCMWTLARSVSGDVPVTPQQIEGLIHVCESAPTAEIRVKAVGVLGNIARRQPGFVQQNNRIGVYLLDNIISKPLLGHTASSTAQKATLADNDGDIEPIVEALDLIYDIYGDKTYDYDAPVFIQGNFLARLRQLYQPIRKLSKSIDRRKDRGLRDRADLAVENLHGFLAYKESEYKN